MEFMIGFFGGLVVIFLLLVLYFIPAAWKIKDIKRLSEKCERERLLALTYDDGPGRELTSRLLKLLEKYEVKASFFLLGRRLRNSVDIPEKLINAGHELGCHSQNHLNAWKIFPWRALKDIKNGYKTLDNWISDSALYRPPYGKITLPVWWMLKQKHAPLAWWTDDCGDTWKTLPVPEEIVKKILKKGGGVVLMHDFDRDSERMDYVIKTTELLLEGAKEEGIQVIKLGDILHL